MNDHLKISSLEEKYQKLSEEYGKSRNMVGNLEKLHRNNDHQKSIRKEQNPAGDGRPHFLKTLLTNRVHSSSYMTEHFGKHFSKTDMESVQVHSNAESTTNDQTKFRNDSHGHTRRIGTTLSRQVRSDNPNRGVAPRVGEGSTDVVAFSVYLSSVINEPGDDYIIRYDRVVTNVGNSYNPMTGVFTCPKAGAYVLTWSTGMLHTGYIYSKLVKNGIHLAYSYAADDHYGSMSSQTSVLVLNRGDIIAVKVGGHSSSPALMNGDTSFNGFILH